MWCVHKTKPEFILSDSLYATSTQDAEITDTAWYHMAIQRHDLTKSAKVKHCLELLKSLLFHDVSRPVHLSMAVKTIHLIIMVLVLGIVQASINKQRTANSSSEGND